MSGADASVSGDQHNVDNEFGARTPLVERGDDVARILVIDGNLLVAEAIVSALTNLNYTARFVMPITTTHVRDLLVWSPDLVLLDIDSVNGAVCLNLVAVLSDACVPVAIMGSRLDVRLVGECIDAGAESVVDKSSPLSELAGIITRLLTGRAVLDEEEKRRILAPIEREAAVRRARLAPFDALTYREKCILAELMEGHVPEAIARRSVVSVLTVRSQIKSILQKLGVNSQLAAVSLAQRAGWTLDEGELAKRRPGPQERVSRLGFTA
jgi:two-component system, NarL family, nitrate/nitrite response regulator NarL